MDVSGESGLPDKNRYMVEKNIWTHKWMDPVPITGSGLINGLKRKMAIFGQTRNPEWKSQFNSSKKRPFFPTMTKSSKASTTSPKPVKATRMPAVVKGTKETKIRERAVKYLKGASDGSMDGCRCYAELPTNCLPVYEKLRKLNLLWESEETGDYHVMDNVYEAYITHGMDYLVENRHLFPLVAENPYA